MSDKLNLVFKARRPTDAAIITQALEWLRAGMLASAIPARLMEEYGLTPDHARELAGKAIELLSRPGRGRLDTEPLKPGE